ncbi:MAG: DNA recombination protein RmuC [bacterium]
MSLLVVFGAVALVGVAAWMWSGAVTRSRMQRVMMQVEMKAESLQAANEALHGQLDKLDLVNEEMRRQLDKEKESRVQAQTRLEEASRGIKEQRKLLDEATEKLKGSFNRMATGVLKSNNEMFIDLARQALESVVGKAEGGIDRQHAEMKNLVGPIAEALQKFEARVDELEAERQTAYGSLESQMAGLSRTSETLQRETAALVSALKRPHGGGAWGRVSLRHVVEMAGLAEFCEFSDLTPAPEGERARPDLLVRLPGGRSIAVDARVPLASYVEAMEAGDDSTRDAKLVEYAAAVREHLKGLGPNGHGDAGRPDVSVMFLPGDAFLSAAVEQDRELVDDGLRTRVVMATPATLVALLKSVALTWQQEKVTVRSEEIRAAGKDLFERVSRFTDHLEEVGEGLRRASKSYNDAVANWNTRLVPGARRMGELTSATSEPVEQAVPQPVEQVIQAVRS